MSGINTGTGLISGLDYSSIINQLLSLEARPRTLAQQRVVGLQGDQAAFLDLSGRLNAVKAAASKFRTANIFRSTTVATSNAESLTGTASAGASLGGFSFLVDRVVGTQQVLSRSFADRTNSGIGATSITFESARARIDSDTPLAELNGGEGVERGKIIVTDNAGHSATIDLSRTATVGELLDALNTNATVRITARAEGDKLIIEDDSGVPGTLRIENAVGYTTATSLGIEGEAVNAPLEGAPLYSIGDRTGLGSLNDGNGVRFNNAAGVGSTADFTIKTRDGQGGVDGLGTYAVDIGDVWEDVGGVFTKTKSAVSDIAGLKARILEQTGGKVSVEVSGDGRALRLVDSSTPSGGNNFEVIDLHGAAADLRIVGSTASDSIDGAAVLAGLNSTLAANLGGGAGLASGEFTITARDGTQHNFAVTDDGSVADILRDINEQTGGAIVASVSSSGVGITLTDTTGGDGELIVEGAGAEALGLATGALGFAQSTHTGTRLQHRYISEATLLSSLNGGAGVGTGRIEIQGPDARAVIDIGSDSRNLADVIQEINGFNIGVRARINDRGDGLILEKDPSSQGVLPIEVKDLTGTVARGLNIVGKAENGDDENFVDGSFERTVELTAADTLDTLVTKINAGRTGVTASVIRDGSGSSPFRLKLTASQSGRAGGFVVDAVGADLGLDTISEARNARVFFGSDDPARAVLLESSSNTFDGVVDGLTITARAASDEAVTLTVAQDTGAITAAVNEFVAAFNDVTGRIARYTDYDEQTQTKGTLLGDSTANELRRALYDQLLKPARGLSGPYRYLSQVGIKVGSGGTLTVDSAKLNAALAADPQAVADLFVAREQEPPETRREISPGVFVVETAPPGFTSLGVAEQFAQLLERYTTSAGGVISSRTSAIGSEIASQNSRIESLTAKLERRREYLTRQFATLEQTLANLQRQQAAIGQLR